MLETFTERNIGPFIEDIKAALRGVCEKHGVDIDSDGGKYEPSKAHLKFKFTVKNVPEGVLTIEQRQYDINRKAYGLPTRGSICRDPRSGKNYLIKHYKMRARKNNIVIEEVSSGIEYVIPHTHLAKWQVIKVAEQG